MRLAMLGHDPGPGARELLLETVEGLRERGHRVRVHWQRGRNPEKHSRGRHLRGPAQAWRRRRPVESTLGLWRPDLLHVLPATHALARVSLLERARCPVVVSVCGAEPVERRGDPRWSALWRRADGVHLIGDAALGPATESGMGSVPMALTEPAAPVSLVRAAAREPRPGPGPLRVLSAGRFTWSQGFEHSIAAIGLLAADGVEVSYRIAGTGPHHDAVAFARHSLGLADRVALIGDTATAKLASELAGADVVLVPALAPNATPLAAAAWASGAHVVATAASGVPDPLLSAPPLPSGDPGAIAAALSELAAPLPVVPVAGAAGEGAGQTVDALERLYGELLTAR